MALNKTNAKIESIEDRRTQDGRPYYEVQVRFDRSNKLSRIRLFDEQLETFQRHAERIYHNGMRVNCFYNGDLDKKDGTWVIWSGIKA